MCIKVMDDTGYGNATSISAGMEFAIEHGADVLNMSLGIPFASAAVREMLRGACVNALQCGIAAAVAVGNDGQLQISFPVPNNVRVPGGCPPPWIHPDQESNAGGLSCCIAVGAVDFNNVRPAFSSYGPFTWQETAYADYPYNPGMGLIRPDISAPGVGIISAAPNSNTGHVSMEGTSQAAPCVAGVIALMLEKNPEITPAEISMILETTAVKLEDNKNNYTGSGCIDALAAIQSIEGGEPEVEECQPTTEVNVINVDEHSITLAWNSVETARSYDIHCNGNFLINITDTTFIDMVLTPDTEYCYTIVSVCEESKSEHSEEVCATTSGIEPCPTPQNLNATIAQDVPDYDHTYMVTLSWEAASYSDRYEIYLDGEFLAETTSTAYLVGFDEEGSHYFTVVNDCQYIDSPHSEAFEFELIGESIEEHENKFEIYPNPVDDVLYIKSDNNIEEINIYNIVGIKVATVSGQQSAISVDMSGFNTGVYFVEVDGKTFRIIRN